MSADFPSKFSYEKPIVSNMGYGVTISGIRDMNGTRYTVWNFDTIEKYCGVIHMNDIKLAKSPRSLKSANVDVYMETFYKINQKRDPEWTQHRYMMWKLNHWNKFTTLVGKVRKTNGEYNDTFDITSQSELWFGFTKKEKYWAPGSCTLNPWFNRGLYLTDEEKEKVLNTIVKAGVYSSDHSKETLHNLVPRTLWDEVLMELLVLTPEWCNVWNSNWARSHNLGDEEKEFSVEQCERIRRLFHTRSMASKYFLDLTGDDLGAGGPSTAEGLAKVFVEEDWAELRWLAIGGNSFNHQAMTILGSAIKSLPNLEILVVDRVHFPFCIFLREDIDGLVLWGPKTSLDHVKFFKEFKQKEARLTKCFHIFADTTEINESPSNLLKNLVPSILLFDFRFGMDIEKVEVGEISKMEQFKNSILPQRKPPEDSGNCQLM